jgi:hypothetical protein
LLRSELQRHPRVRDAGEGVGLLEKRVGMHPA